MVATGDPEKSGDYSKALQFIVVLVKYCINAIAKELVLDNFIGSGIIAIAAKE